MTDVPPKNRNLWGQRGNIPLPPARRAPDGSKLCRWCWEPIPKRRQFWCGDDCVTDYRRRADWAFIRERIIERDKICRCCGGCTYVCKGGKWRAPIGWTVKPFRRDQSTFYGFPVGQIWGPFNILEQRWEVDHIRAVIEGGTDDPANLRLLCVPCHHLRTAVWLRDRAAGPQAPLALD